MKLPGEEARVICSSPRPELSFSTTPPTSAANAIDTPTFAAVRRNLIL